jgi:dGTP triphosphohydrolase
MPISPKKTNKSITFTPEAADQTLLAAIEAALTQEQYDSFSDLCKQALQQVLLDTQSAPVHDEVDWATVLAPLHQQIAQLEAKLPDSLNLELMQLLQAVEQSHNSLQQQVETVHNQLSSWKQPTNNQTTEYLNQLTSQLVHLTTQVEAIETQISQRFADLQSQLSQAQPALPSPVPLPKAVEASSETRFAQTGIPTTTVAAEPIFIFKEPVATSASSHESDPILSRLSSLLENF